MTTQSASEPSFLPAIPTGPERSFRVARPTEDGGIVSSSMPTGPWLNGPAGRPAAGALGVLIDNVLGYALMLNRPPGLWSISAEISLDLAQEFPADGSELTAQGRRLATDATGGLASGAVFDADGQIIAVSRQHGRWVPDDAVAGAAPPAQPGPAPGQAPAPAANLTELLGEHTHAHATDDGARLDLTVTPDLVNPLGNLHGGITLCLCDVLAHAALSGQRHPTPARTASIHVAYVRALPLGATASFHCEVAYRGRSFALIRIGAVNEAGKPCVIATVTTTR
ncbi:MAG TPA: hotdog fold thioesterase [Streptosporangiaceae bacterium]|jgi:uncharacterized protein (TIGR00369 family)